ncbi:MAG: hypothetical protein V4508_20350 [Pseudomonadota bacterium]
MRTPVVVFLVAAMSLAAGAAAAQSAPQTAPAMSEIQVSGVASHYKPRPDEAAALPGNYNLSNGQNLKVSSLHRKLYAQIDQRGMTELVPVAANLFVTADRSMTMEFDLGTLGEGMLLTYVPDLTAALQVPVTVRIAMNR